MRLVNPLFLASIIALVSLAGCLCCGMPGSGGNEGGAIVTDSSCSRPYMDFEGDCCLDANGNSICDSPEATTTIPKDDPTIKATSTTVKATTTTIKATTTIPPTTTTLKSSVAACVEKAGYASDSILFAYSNKCGASERTKLANYGLRKGIDYQYIDIGILSEKEKEILGCFYGPYSEYNKKYQLCPMFLCPLTGGHEPLTHGSVTIKAASFSKKCTLDE
ncbi:hypothetical protein ACFLRF_04730 [Candidatus Altiarchaeota archaeon]